MTTDEEDLLEEPPDTLEEKIERDCLKEEEEKMEEESEYKKDEPEPYDIPESYIIRISKEAA